MSGLTIEGTPAPAATPAVDAALVARLVGRDPAAVAEVYDRYAERLLGFCTGMLRDPHEAADALHDTILVAAERIGQLRDPARLRPWLYAIARTQCLARLRRRERTVVAEDPTELSGGRAVAADTAGDAEGDGARAVEGGEASALVWAAAEGLDEGDRVLLELHLRQGLSGGELAAAAGVRPGQISMVTGRMRERLERALGALLVARHGRPDCDDLDALLRDWDGRLTVLMRKRVARHVDRCTTCDDQRNGLVAPLGSLAVAAPAVVVTGDVRAAVLAGAEQIWGGAAAPDVTGATRWDVDGFPPDPPGPGGPAGRDEITTRVRRRTALAAAAAVLVLLGGLVTWWSTVSSGEDEIRAGGPAAPTAGPGADGGDPRSGEPGPTATGGEPGPSAATDPVTTTAGTTPVAPPPPTTAGPPLGAGGPGPVAGPTAPDGGLDAGSASPPPAPPASPPPAPPNPAPTIGPTTLDEESLQTTCNPAGSTATVSAPVSDTGGTLTVALAFVRPDGTTGQKQMVGGGTWTATLGPFSTVGTATWWVVASDGTHSVESPRRTVAVDPCPG